MRYYYYYNNVPKKPPTRNNLIYTSLISEDQKTFVQWYYNDTKYHKDQNEIVDPAKMEEKWDREVRYLTLMATHYSTLVPKIIDIDYLQRKIYLEIDGVDFWNRANCTIENYNLVLSNWQDQMCNIIQAHKLLGLHKYSMHPSSYFLIDGKLKSINYFFTYHQDEPHISIEEVESHIHSDRQAEMRKHLATLDIEWNTPQPWNIMDQLCWESFGNVYPKDFIKRIKNI
jgi:hypothetical protein